MKQKKNFQSQEQQISETQSQAQTKKNTREFSSVEELLRFDAQRLRILVERHLLHTGSERARAILEDWDNAVGHFVKIMPIDYRRALMDLQTEQTAAKAAAAD